LRGEGRGEGDLKAITGCYNSPPLNPLPPGLGEGKMTFYECVNVPLFIYNQNTIQEVSMKKLLLFIVVVVGIAWAGTSWYVGRQTESFLQQFIKAQNEQTSSMGITQELVSYKRSLLGARAITRLNISASPLNTFIDEIQFVNDITNGPVFFGGTSPVHFGIAYITSHLDMDSLNKKNRDWIATAFGGDHPFQTRAFINFNGITDYLAVFNPLILEMDGATISIDGADLTGSADTDMLGTYRIQTGMFEVRGADSFFSVPSIQISGTVTGMIAGQAIGSFSISAPQIAIKASETSETIMFDADITSSSEVKNDTVEGSVRLLVDSIQGAGDVLSKIDYWAEFHGMHIDGLEALHQIRMDMANLQNQTGWNDETMQTPEDLQKNQEMMSDITGQLVDAVFSKLLQTGKSRIRFDLKAENPDGMATIDIDLTYAGEGTPNMAELMSYGPDEWAKMMQGTIALAIDQGILPEGAVMLAMPFIQQGLIVQKGDRLHAAMKIEGDSIVLNGTRMRLSELLHMLSPATGAAEVEEDIDATYGIPADLMMKIQNEGLTPEIMQLLEERDDIPEQTMEMFRQIQQLQQDMLDGTMPATR
jgi:uncharacterized protein YdgA (DUF945 family)